MIDEDSRGYHLRELQIARDPAADGHLLPPVTSLDRAILDIGCGAGQTLIGSNLTSEQSAVGVDVDAQALALGRQLHPSLLLICARAESLPLPSDVFDLVISRVALPYTDIPRALHEISRVLKRGGRCWIVLHPMSMAARSTFRHLTRGQIKGTIFQLYTLLNGLSLHLFGRQFPFPFKPNRPFESCQTRRGVERALRASGMVDISVRRDRHFVMTATRR
jgi:SAM-dependent methyltransferase